LAAELRLLADERELELDEDLARGVEALFAREVEPLFARELEPDFAREVDADLARVADAFARVVDAFAREPDDLEVAVDLRVDPPLRPAGALRALGMKVSSPAVGRRRDYLTRALAATDASNTIHR
jgi:hypothetical protein